jgi:hypothetical protein
MDPSRFAVTFAVLMIAVGVGRVVLPTFERVGDGMATLFVPPDRALGWPHGVQEGDEPWGWLPGAPSGLDHGPWDGGGGNDDPTAGPSDPSDWVHPAHGRFVVPVEPVRQVRTVVRPH